MGNTVKDEIVRCALGAACVPLVTPYPGEQGYVLGLKIDRRSATVWATSNAPTAASLRQYDIESGKLIRSAQREGKHVFNYVAVSPEGVIYVTDTSEGSVYKLDKQTSALRKIAPQHKFTAANGIAISPDGKTLYVSAWGDGIDAIDLSSGSVTPVHHPEAIGLTFIDGFYADKDSLIAIQNGPMLPRIVQFKLDEHGREIIGMTILERRNPFFDGITTSAGRWQTPLCSKSAM